jgi:tetratricopeptide (TPR) repeat protein
MSESTHPSMDELLDALARLADRVASGAGPRLEPFVSLSLRRLTQELRMHIPGLETPPDAEAARFIARAATAALEDGDAREALARALRGLSMSPHHPALFYTAASACFEFGSVEDAVRLLRHTLWINPGHQHARRDLAALNLYLRDRWESPGEISADEGLDVVQAGADNPELAFDIAGDEFDVPFTDQEDLEGLDEGEDRAA